ncbi:unnamed protein product [Cuscuta europaea]|uniref:Pentatricopeptide repeat-containing protein n=1 Tax=Cuscuta europaea TaxID=41803 RepID=A0A9P1E8D6_CUSEU|nr:unnamed protein product [Cuscuta europaea]
MKKTNSVPRHYFNWAFRGLSTGNINSLIPHPHSFNFPGFHDLAFVCKTQDSYFELSKSKFASINNLEDAIVLYRQMVTMRPRPPTEKFNQILNAVVKMGCYHDAFSLFQDIFASALFLIDECTLNIVANSLTRLSKVDLVFAILGIHLKLGLVANAVSFNTLLKGLFLQHRVQDAVWLFQKSLNEKVCEVNEVTLSILIDGLCKAGHTVKASKLLHLFEEKGNCKPNVFSYNTVIDSVQGSNV